MLRILAVATVLVLIVMSTVACSSSSGDYGACKANMERLAAEGILSNGSASPSASDMAPCKGLSTADLQKIVGQVMQDQLKNAFSGTGGQ